MLAGNEGQSLGRVLKLHRVTFFRSEIDRDLPGDEFPGGDFSESPTAVGDEGAGREFLEGFGVGGSDLAGFDVGIQVFAHECADSSGPRAAREEDKRIRSGFSQMCAKSVAVGKVDEGALTCEKAEALPIGGAVHHAGVGSAG